jgi:hypothetical protein
MKSFKSFLNEGGNIKVGPKGQETSAAPFPVRSDTRSARRTDVHTALSKIHDAFHKEHGEHLFGANKTHLKTGHVYSGSSHDFMGGHVSDDEFAKHKPHVGDVDVQVSHEHKEKLASTLATGKKFGNYTVVGTKKHGNEISAVMRHKNGEHHQFDFEGVHNPGSETDRFLHSSSWEDTKSGIKGVHHKMLINAASGSTHKFSISHGLRSRTEDNDLGVQHPHEISKQLFGNSADHEKIKSFKGVADLIKKHIPKAQHQEIYDKFSSGLAKMKGMDHGPAIEHLRKTLGAKDTANESYIEEEVEQHAHVAFMGASPHTHMGHHIDVVGGMGAGKKFVGLSGKSDVFSDKEREHIANKQSNGSAEFKIEKTAGQTVGRAFHSLKGPKKVLHLHFGHDRKEMAEGLKKSIESGKIPELNGEKPHRVEIHYPKDENRSHGFRGETLRNAAASGDEKTYKTHLGPNFSDAESKSIMNRTRVGLLAGKIKLKR